MVLNICIFYVGKYVKLNTIFLAQHIPETYHLNSRRGLYAPMADKAEEPSSRTGMSNFEQVVIYFFRPNVPVIYHHEN